MIASGGCEPCSPVDYPRPSRWVGILLPRPPSLHLERPLVSLSALTLAQWGLLRFPGVDQMDHVVVVLAVAWVAVAALLVDTPPLALAHGTGT